MIEAFWKQLKYQWLYLHHLDTITTLRRLVAAYVADHNGLIPGAELGARTLDEAYAEPSCVPIPDHLRRTP